MNGQFNLFETGKQKLELKKPIRLVELFAGYGSQALALKYLGVDFEHWVISEWAIKSIQAYKDMHFDDDIDYSKEKDISEIKNWLSGRISRNYNDPLMDKDINRLKDEEVKKIYNNMVASHNIGSVVMAKAEDLKITERDKYTYIMTYSFPCQDLSRSGKGAGMERDSGTRSGMLWQVERLLKECKELNGNLPDILLMENVPQVITVKGFTEWIESLNELGYTSAYESLSALDYGVPQNRERTFMVSWLGDYYYHFPEKTPLTKCIEDILEDDVDDSYFISDKMLQGMIITNFHEYSIEHNILDRGGVE